MIMGIKYLCLTNRDAGQKLTPWIEITVYAL